MQRLHANCLLTFAGNHSTSNRPPLQQSYCKHVQEHTRSLSLSLSLSCTHCCTRLSQCSCTLSGPCQTHSEPRNKSLWDHVMQRILATGICAQNVRSARKLFAAVCGRSVTNRTPLHLSLRAAANINTHTYTLAHTRATTTITQAFLHTPAHTLIRIAGSLTQKQEMIGDVQCRESWQQESACKM